MLAVLEAVRRVIVALGKVEMLIVLMIAQIIAAGRVAAKIVAVTIPAMAAVLIVAMVTVVVRMHIVLMIVRVNAAVEIESCAKPECFSNFWYFDVRVLNVFGSEFDGGGEFLLLCFFRTKPVNVRCLRCPVFLVQHFYVLCFEIAAVIN